MGRWFESIWAHQFLISMFTTQDFLLIGLLVFLEGILSIDNALVLALLAKPLPKEQQKRALTYGLFGAILFRLIALSLVNYLLAWNWVKFVGGGYLLYISIHHFIKTSRQKPEVDGKKVYGSFWKTVLVIELTDIAFAIDSILAAVALSNKFWVVFIGGALGIIAMRFAAGMFIKVLDKFPRFETTAYLLVLVIGVKVVLEGLRLPGLEFHSPDHVSFWIFWVLMATCLGFGFLPKKSSVKGHGNG